MSRFPVTVFDGTRVVDVTLSPDTSPLGANDVAVATQVIKDALGSDQEGGVLLSVQVIDKDDQKAALTLFFFDADVSLGTANAAPSITDADAARILGKVDVGTADYHDLGGVSVASPAFDPFGLKPAPATRNIYVAVRNGAGTPTYTANGLVLRLTII